MEERLQKWIARCGISSRRAAEELLRQGRVTLNGRVAGLGESGDPERDTLLVDGRPVAAAPEPVYLMLNKPRGYVTTLSDERGRKTAAELVADCGRRVFPVGRLDKDSEGLLLFTNDGTLAQQLLHPRHQVDKVYQVTVSGALEGAEERLSRMRMLEGEPIQPAQVRRLSQKGETAVLEVIIHQGKNRQIRRMCEAVGLEVARLKRTYIGPVKLGMLQPGEYRELTPAELSAIRGYMNKAVNRRQNAEGEKAAAERGSRPAKKAPVKPAGKDRTPLGRR